MKFDFQNSGDFEDGIHDSSTNIVEVDFPTHLQVVVENSLAAPGFEGENPGEPWDGSTRGGRSIISTDAAHSGEKVLRTVAGRWVRQVHQQVEVTEGAAYHASGWIRAFELQAVASIELRWRNGEGQIIGTDLVGALAGNNGTHPWTEFDGVFVAPPDATTVWFNLVVSRGQGGAAWFDDNILGAP